MHDLRERQAVIDYHLEMARKCLALSDSQQSLLSDDPVQSEEVVQQLRQGSRIATKIVHLRNLIAALTPVPATTEVNQYSVLNRFRAGVGTLWRDKRENGERDRIDLPFPRLVQVHGDPPPSRRSLEFSSSSTTRHRRAGSSGI